MSKICPLMSNQTEKNSEWECLEGDCGWWDFNEHQCILLTIGGVK